jgi:hypothetical protein
MDTEVLQAQMDVLAAVGALFPPDFLDSLALAASCAALDFLRDVNAPGEVTEALDMAFNLQLVSHWIKQGEKPHTGTLADIPETVAKLIRLTLVLGGSLAEVAATSCEDAPVTWNPLGLADVPADEATEPSEPA